MYIHIHTYIYMPFIFPNIYPSVYPNKVRDSRIKKTKIYILAHININKYIYIYIYIYIYYIYMYIYIHISSPTHQQSNKHTSIHSKRSPPKIVPMPVCEREYVFICTCTYIIFCCLCVCVYSRRDCVYVKEQVQTTHPPHNISSHSPPAPLLFFVWRKNP